MGTLTRFFSSHSTDERPLGLGTVHITPSTASMYIGPPPTGLPQSAATLSQTKY